MDDKMELVSAKWMGKHSLEIVVEADYYSLGDHVEFKLQNPGINPAICIVSATLIRVEGPMKGSRKKFSGILDTDDAYDFKEVTVVFTDGSSKTKVIQPQS